MWACSLELVDDCAGRGLFAAPDEYHGEPACRSCIEAVGPAAGQGYDDFPATTSFPITD
jgi:hypothetical protein